jgi:hypothetical protein
VPTVAPLPTIAPTPSPMVLPLVPIGTFDISDAPTFWSGNIYASPSTTSRVVAVIESTDHVTLLGPSVRADAEIALNTAWPTLRWYQVNYLSILDHHSYIGWWLSPGLTPENTRFASSSSLQWVTPTAIPSSSAAITVATTTRAAPLPTTAPASLAATAWRDPQSRIALTYPGNWQAVPFTAPGEIFEIDSGDGVHLTIYASRAQGDAMSGLTSYQSRQNARTDRAYRFASSTVAHVGGQPAISDEFVSVSTKNPPDQHTGQIVYVVAGEWSFAFESYTDGPTSRRVTDVQAILQSVVFPAR